MFPVAGKTASDIDRAASTVKSKMTAMIAEQYIIRTVTTQNNAKKKKNLYFVWYNMESGKQ